MLQNQLFRPELRQKISEYNEYACVFLPCQGKKSDLSPIPIFLEWVLATVNSDGVPNIIYATCVGVFDDELLVVADNYFDKTRKNIALGGTGSILFMTKQGKAYQAKGKLEYYKEGPVFDDMKSWNPEQHPGHAAAAIGVEEVFSGAAKVC